MKKITYLALSTLVATPAIAQEVRQLDAHEHGVGQLDIAVDGDDIAMALHAPGADIVGFEYEATSTEDRAAIEAAVALLEQPLMLFAVPDAAGCVVVDASAELETEGEHEGHDDHDDHDDHDEHEGHDDHDDHDEHEDHDEHDDHDDHDEHEDHDEHDDHDDHDEHEDHDEHDEHDDHDDHEEHADHDDHEDHADAAGHTEFHAEYLLTCSDPAAIDQISFDYFASFPNALEVDVQVVTGSGAASFEVERDAPTLDLSGLF